MGRKSSQKVWTWLIQDLEKEEIGEFHRFRGTFYSNEAQGKNHCDKGENTHRGNSFREHCFRRKTNRGNICRENSKTCFGEIPRNRLGRAATKFQFERRASRRGVRIGIFSRNRNSIQIVTVCCNSHNSPTFKCQNTKCQNTKCQNTK